MQVLLDEERVRVIGVSNFLERHLEMILEECSVVPHVNQCEFHPFNNPKALRHFCADRNIQFEVRLYTCMKDKILLPSLILCNV